MRYLIILVALIAAYFGATLYEQATAEDCAPQGGQAAGTACGR